MYSDQTAAIYCRAERWEAGTCRRFALPKATRYTVRQEVVCTHIKGHKKSRQHATVRRQHFISSPTAARVITK